VIPRLKPVATAALEDRLVLATSRGIVALRDRDGGLARLAALADGTRAISDLEQALAMEPFAWDGARVRSALAALDRACAIEDLAAPKPDEWPARYSSNLEFFGLVAGGLGTRSNGGDDQVAGCAHPQSLPNNVVPERR
jgi:hypothetical protein